MIDPQRVLGGLVGIAAGGARGTEAGVRVSGSLREPDRNGVERGAGRSGSPQPCWTEQTALAYCTVDALLGDYSLERLGSLYSRWLAGDHWTSPPSVDLVSPPIVAAIQRIERGVPAEDAGFAGGGDPSTDSSSLIRVLPVAIAFSRRSIPIMLDAVHSAMKVTHVHSRCLMAAGLLSLIVRNLAYRRAFRAAYRYAMEDARRIYVAAPWRMQRAHFRRLMRGTLNEVAKSAIRVDNDVSVTLEAAVWSLQTTRTYQDCVAQAIDLGKEQTTVGALAGGLAGVAHGFDGIPSKSVNALAEREKLIEIASRFAAVVTV